MSSAQQENRPGRFATEAQRRHVREMFAQYNLSELSAIRAEIDKLISEKQDSCCSQDQERSRVACV